MLWRDAVVFGLLAAAGLAVLIAGGLFQGEWEYSPWLATGLEKAEENIWYPLFGGTILFIILFMSKYKIM